jgi:exosortase
VSTVYQKWGVFALWAILGILTFLSFGSTFRSLLDVWLHSEEFSYGILIPALAAYLIWTRRKSLRNSKAATWNVGLLIAMVGCALQVEASWSGTLLLSGLAFVVTSIGVTGFLWGRRRLDIAAGPLALLVLMVPLPSYVVDELSWHLQSIASTVSGTVLSFLGVPVYQDGNLLKLPNYVLEVKNACSGSRSIFALLALACVLGLSTKRRFWVRTALILVAPVLATGANVIRIVGTGLIAREWGNVAANESLHTAWGVAVFLIAAMGLFGVNRLLREALWKSA